MHKIEGHTFKNFHNFLQSLTDKPIGDRLMVFSEKTLYVWIESLKLQVSKARAGSPGVS